MTGHSRALRSVIDASKGPPERGGPRPTLTGLLRPHQWSTSALVDALRQLSAAPATGDAE